MNSLDHLFNGYDNVYQEEHAHLKIVRYQVARFES